MRNGGLRMYASSECQGQSAEPHSLINTFTIHRNAAQRQKLYLRNRICAPSEDSDQPAHSRSLIRIFTRHILDSQGYKVSLCGERTLRPDCAGAQADLRLL